MLRTAASFVLLLVCCTIAVLPLGCSKDDPTSAVSNIRPETHLSFSPDAGDTVSYRVRMNWFGWDPDGEVTHFLTMWDSLEWIYTTATESVFVVSTGDSMAPRDQSYGHHTFSVKAVDDRGDEDLTPATVSFTAENVFPETEIVSGPAGISGPYATFEWIGSDPEGDIAGYGYRLMVREGAEYVEYFAVDELPPDQTSASFGPLAGQHRFEVWSIDGQGARDPSPAAWTFSCHPVGPMHFLITSNILADGLFYSRLWWPYPDAWTHAPIPIFAGEHVTFDWSAEGQGLQYRYAYGDTMDWTPWSPDATHFEFTANAGEHEIHVAAKDTLGTGFHVHLRLEALTASLDDYILIVDDYTHWETNPNWGTDEDRDAFYDAIVAPFGERYQWDPAEHEVEGRRLPPDIETLADASTVIWYCGPGEDVVIGDLLGQYGASYDVLGGYVRSGGNLVLSGWKALSQVAEQTYPIDPGSGDETPGLEFIRDVLRIGHVDHSGESVNPDVPWSYGYCFHGALPTVEGDGLGFEPAYVDTGQCPDSPGKWFPFCQPPQPNYDRCGLSVEEVTPHMGESVELLAVHSLINPVFDGKTCAALYLSGADKGNVCYLGFPLYYLQTQHAETLLHNVLTLYGENER